MARRGSKNQVSNGKKQATRSQAQSLRDIVPLFRVPKMVDHKFVRTWDFGNLSAGISDGGWGFAFQLSNLPSNSDFTTLYDFYRIDGVEIIWELVPTASATTKTSSIMPVILAYPDYDDATAPTSRAVAQQVGQMERLQLSEARPSVRRLIHPRLIFGLAGAGANLGGSKPAGFVDMTETGALHYGVKFWINNFNSTTLTETGATIALSFRFHMTMRNPR